MTLKSPISNSLGMNFVYIPPGTFTMGSPEDEPLRKGDEKQHTVSLTWGYYLQTTPVTQKQWEAVMEMNPSYFRKAGPDAPVERVSWYDAQMFIDTLNSRGGTYRYRLPTEAEWEYACRAGTQTAVYNTRPIEILGWNNVPALDSIAWYSGNSGVSYEGGWDSSKWTEMQYPRERVGTHPVGLKTPNSWGLHDMIGNVQEWCRDWYDKYPNGTVIDPSGPEIKMYRVMRGGSWYDVVGNLRSAARDRDIPGSRHANLGFRVAMDPIEAYSDSKTEFRKGDPISEIRAILPPDQFRGYMIGRMIEARWNLHSDPTNIRENALYAKFISELNNK